jgi:hypothetical protein
MAKKPSQTTISFAKLSKAVQALNPHLQFGDLVARPVEQPWNARQGGSEPKKAQSTAKPVSDGPAPNKTEQRFRDYWEAINGGRKLHFQPITLRIGRRRYTPDWVYFGAGRITLFEIKGPYIYEKNKIKYDLFKTTYLDRFDFEFWQEEDRMWQLIR